MGLSLSGYGIIFNLNWALSKFSRFLFYIIVVFRTFALKIKKYETSITPYYILRRVGLDDGLHEV